MLGLAKFSGLAHLQAITAILPNLVSLYTLNDANAYSTTATDQFGFSSAICDSYAIVGASLEDDAAGPNSGKAYIYSTTTGALLYTLNNPNPNGTVTSDNFGYSVGISSLYAIVGTPGEDELTMLTSGKAYIYSTTTGLLLYTLNNPNAYGTSAGDNFGISVSISDSYAIVGAQFEDDAGGTSAGKAYIFSTTTGLLLYTLNDANAYGTSAGDNFGISVSISDSYAIVGAHFEDDAGIGSSGKAYIYSPTTGALLYTLNDANAYGTGANDNFGYSVAISSLYAIVGAPGEGDAGGTSAGKAYIYSTTTGLLLYTLANPNAYSTSVGDQFGTSVSISDSYAIVGAPGEDDAGGLNAGKAYIYSTTTGALLYTLNDVNAYGTSTSDAFGTVVGISNNRVIVSTYLEDDAGGTSAGKAYIYSI